MGTVNWTLGTYGRDKARSIMGSRPISSDAFTSSTSAANITGLSPRVGDVLRVHASTAGWMDFGGRTAAAGSGHYIPADATVEFEIAPGDDGNVSFIDL